MTHTLGPWRIAGPCPTNAVSFNIRADNHSEGSGALLFTTGPMFHDYDIDPKEAEANARLAAAAPELLTALQAIVDRAADPRIHLLLSKLTQESTR